MDKYENCVYGSYSIWRKFLIYVSLDPNKNKFKHKTFGLFLNIRHTKLFHTIYKIFQLRITKTISRIRSYLDLFSLRIKITFMKIQRKIKQLELFNIKQFTLSVTFITRFRFDDRTSFALEQIKNTKSISHQPLTGLYCSDNVFLITLYYWHKIYVWNRLNMVYVSWKYHL